MVEVYVRREPVVGCVRLQHPGNFKEATDWLDGTAGVTVLPAKIPLQRFGADGMIENYSQDGLAISTPEGDFTATFGMVVMQEVDSGRVVAMDEALFDQAFKPAPAGGGPVGGGA